MTQVSWSTSVQLADGQQLSMSMPPFEAEATQHVSVSIVAGEADRVVTLHAGPASDVHLLAIQSSHYDDVSYKASDGTTDTADIELLGPQLLSGGIVALLGVDPQQLKFTNAGSNDAQISIFVARDATP